MLNAAAAFTHQQRKTKPLEKKGSLMTAGGTAFSDNTVNPNQIRNDRRDSD